MRKLYDLEKEKICWKPWMISGVGIWTGLVAMGLLLFAVACSEGTGGGQSSEDLILFSWEDKSPYCQRLILLWEHFCRSTGLPCGSTGLWERLCIRFASLSNEQKKDVSGERAAD